MPQTDEKFHILSREAGIITELLTSGLENLRRISIDQAFYYQAFYSLSIGLERFLKLIIYVENPATNLRSFGHRLVDLRRVVDIRVIPNSIEENFFIFLNNFATGDRYSILDYLSGQNTSQIIDEPIVKFYNDIFLEVLRVHPPKRAWIPPQIDFASVFHTREDLTEINNFADLVVHGQVVDHVSKYCVMYFGRLIQPFIERISAYEGPPNNPFFSEGFRYLRQPDSYFLSRKTFRS